MTQNLEPNVVDVIAPLWAPQSWLQEHTLHTLAELNDDCLQLLCEQARTGLPIPAPMAQLRQTLSALDERARRRAAECSYLLFDAGFNETLRWTINRERGGVGTMGAAPPVAFFSLPRTVEVMRHVLTYAWHLARSHSSAARLLLGMSPRCAELIGTCTLRQVTQLAESRPHWLRPRWAERLPIWRELLCCASAGEASALERIHHRGIQLLAAEVRSFM